MSTHPNSAVALAKIIASGMLSNQESRVIEEVILRGPGTNREIDERLNHGGRSWHPVLHLLEKKKMLTVVRNRACRITGHIVMEYAWSGADTPSQLPEAPTKPDNNMILEFLEEVQVMATGTPRSNEFTEVLEWMYYRYGER